MNVLLRRAQWRAARTRARAHAKADGRCLACLHASVPPGRVTCPACGERANASRKRRRARIASSAIEQARAFGIDIPALLRNGRLSPRERFAKAEGALETTRWLRNAAKTRIA